MSSTIDLSRLLRLLPAPLRLRLDRINLSLLLSSAKHLLSARPGQRGIAVVAGYVVICNALRFRNINRLQRKMGFTDRRSLARMTGDEAQTILRNMIVSEFPTMYELGLQFALFKVCCQCICSTCVGPN